MLRSCSRYIQFIYNSQSLQQSYTLVYIIRNHFCGMISAARVLRPILNHSSSRALFSTSCTRPLAAPSTNSNVRVTARLGLSRRAFFSTTKMSFKKPSEDPPKHEMAYFPDMTTSLPSESGEFRRVMWTGLYSQLVLMTVPVGGDIGDEVSSELYPRISVLTICRNTLSTKS